MGWAVVSVAGFVLMTGLVTVMARSNTSRWEREHRAAQVAEKARAATARSGWTAALGRHTQTDDAPARSHLHLPHGHLPAGLVARLPRPHLPHPHLPHPHLPHPHLRHAHLPWRARTAPELDEPPRAGADAGS